MAALDSHFNLFRPAEWNQPGGGSRYRQLSRHVAEAIADGRLSEGQQLPSERELAEFAGVSRVTIRKAVAELVKSGLIEQRRGAGTFVLGAAPRTEQSLSSLVSFTENMKARGRNSTSEVLRAGLFAPAPEEMMALGLAPAQQVARIDRLRAADGTPMAIENASLPADILPDPDGVGTSLYAVLRKAGCAPSRAIQRVSAINVTGDEARLLGVAENTALLQINRTAYLTNGRPIEYTRGLYRPDIYDFVAELRLENGH